MLVYGANTPLGSRTIVCRLNSLSSSSLIRAADAVAEQRAVGHDDRRPGPGLRRAARSLRMMSCRNSSAVSAVCLSSGKLLWMPLLLLAAEGRVGEDHVDAVLVADLA